MRKMVSSLFRGNRDDEAAWQRFIAMLISRESETEACNVNGASQKREAHDNVQDRCQNNLPSKRLARHTRRSALLRVDDTFLASRETDHFNMLPRITRASQFQPIC
jgi:hypothetical protein